MPLSFCVDVYFAVDVIAFFRYMNNCGKSIPHLLRFWFWCWCTLVALSQAGIMQPSIYADLTIPNDPSYFIPQAATSTNLKARWLLLS